MNKTLLILVLTVFIVTPALAAENSMKNLALNALSDYAEHSYDRGDLPQARGAFNRILQMDPDNAVAKDYLRKMGAVAQRPQVTETNIDFTVTRIETRAPVAELSYSDIDTSQFSGTNADLQAQIAQEDQAIHNLTQDLNSLSAETSSNE